MQQFGFGAEKVKSISNRVRDAPLNLNASITTDDIKQVNSFFPLYSLTHWFSVWSQ